jgi:Leucine-rich repeat (LRR) protein
MRKIKLMIAAVALLMMAASCNHAPVQVSEITLNQTELTLAVGDSETLTAIFTPNNATNQTLTWTSSDPNVASVEDGVITALTAGVAAITATTANGKTADCEVEVVIPPSIEFTFTGTSIEFRVTALSMTVDWGDGTTNDYYNLNRSNVSYDDYASNAEYTVRIYAEGLSHFYCNAQRLTSLDVRNCTDLTVLSCWDNQLTSLDVSNNTALEELNCSDNQLSALDVSKNTALILLYCYNNQLSYLDVSNNTALELFACMANQLNALDVSNNTALELLYCSDNQLSSLDLSSNTALTQLECNNNQLSATALDDMFNTLPDRYDTLEGRIQIYNNPGSNDCNTGIATAKNWVFR